MLRAQASPVHSHSQGGMLTPAQAQQLAPTAQANVHEVSGQLGAGGWVVHRETVKHNEGGAIYTASGVQRLTCHI